MRTRMFCMLAAILIAASGAFAQAAKEPTLKVGDRAPALGEGKWVKGEPVSEFESGKVYVLEFWATWCKPCKEAIPHVTELQKKYADKGVIIIGQNVWEEDPALVAPFVKEMGDKMDYRVVMDAPAGQEGNMAKTWMAAAGRNGIPCSFIVDQDGRIAWIGHPMQMAPVLEKVVAGEYDLEKAKTAAAEEKAKAAKLEDAQQVLNDLMRLAQSGKWDEFYTEADAAIPDIEDPEALNVISWRIVDPENPFPVQNLDVALKAGTKANELTKFENGAMLDTLARVHWLKGDKKKALELQEKAVKVNDQAQFEEELANRLKEYKDGQDEKEE